MNEPVDKMVASGSKKPEAADGAKKGAIVNPFHARLIAKHQQEAVEKAKAEFEAKAKLQEEAWCIIQPLKELVKCLGSWVYLSVDANWFEQMLWWFQHEREFNILCAIQHELIALIIIKISCYRLWLVKPLVLLPI